MQSSRWYCASLPPLALVELKTPPSRSGAWLVNVLKLYAGIGLSFRFILSA